MVSSLSTPVDMDIWVIGAGLSGLLCAQSLRHWGYRVGVVDKSRGLGGRVATRRLEGTCADHGARFLENQGRLTQQLIDLSQGGDHSAILPWNVPLKWVVGDGTQTSAATGNRYAAPLGMTAIAKRLAVDLPIVHSQRIVRLAVSDGHWHLHSEFSGDAPPQVLTAKGVVLAIPAPQALPLLAPLIPGGLPESLVRSLQSVTYDPCLTAIATYPASQPFEAVALRFEDDPTLAWISVEASKRPKADAGMQAVVVQSSAPFARQYLEADNLKGVGEALLAAADAFVSGVRSPHTVQVHRWRYAFVNTALAECPQTPVPLPLVCCGDWCLGKTIESALQSGEQAAQKLNGLLDKRPDPPVSLSPLLP